MVPWVDLQCVIVVFPNHSHLLSVIAVRQDGSNIRAPRSDVTFP